MEKNTIAGLILSGGRNSRMKGRKKLLLTYRGEPFLSWIMRAMAEAKLDQIYLSVDSREAWEKILKEACRPEALPCGFPRLLEDIPKGAGPMGGIFSGLTVCPQDALLVTACDMPLLRASHIRKLLDHFERTGQPTLARAGGRIQPLAGVYRKSDLPVISRYLEAGDYRMMHFIQSLRYQCVEIEAEAVMNINTEEDYRQMAVSSPSVGKEAAGKTTPTGSVNPPSPYIYAVSGLKNSGKTTLVSQLVRILTGRGYRVAVIKHDGHDFEPDVPGTDSDTHRKAGAYGTAVYSANRFMITKECRDFDEKDLIRAFPEADIILIEGLKNSTYPKTVCHYPDQPLPDPEALADYIIKSAGEAAFPQSVQTPV